MNSYRTSTWGDEISLEYGKSLKGYQNSNGTYQVFGSNGPIGWTDKPLCKGPGIILGRKGAYRGVKFSEQDFYVIDTAYYVVPKTDIDLNWLYYAIKYHKLGEIDDGSPIPSTTRAAVYVREFDIPSKEVQVKIGNILKKIDLKIELNNQINETLESIAQARFKSWFIDFDPVRAKIVAKLEGADPEIAAMCVISGKSEAELKKMPEDDFAELQATAALFPDELVENELGEVPKGWDATALGNFLEIKRGGSPRPIQNFMAPTGYPWVKIADATADPSPFLFKTKEFIIKEGLKKTVYLKKGSLILTNSATPGLPKFLELDACIHDGWLYFPQKKHFSDNYLYFLFLKLRTQLVAQGNGSVFTNLKTDILRNQVVLVPTREVIEKFDLQVGKILEMMKTQCIQSSNLSDLRDTLLPKLLSGEPDATLLKE